MNHPGMFAFKGYRLKYHVISGKNRQVNQTIVIAFIPKDIRKWSLTYLTLELPPEDTSVVISYLSIFLSFQPASYALQMNVLDTTSALTYLEQWIVNVEFTIPAETTGCDFFGLSGDWFSFLFVDGFIFHLVSISTWSHPVSVRGTNGFLRWFFVHLTRGRRDAVTVLLYDLVGLLFFFFWVSRSPWQISVLRAVEKFFWVGKQREWFWLSNDWVYTNYLLDLIKILSLVYSKGIF